jgi:sugar phosphate isomerase/epimerase
MVQVLEKIKVTAFHYIDVERDTLDSQALERQKKLGLKVSCVALDHKLPAGCSWDGKESNALRKMVDEVRQSLQISQSLEAKVGYVGCCKDRKQLKPFGEALSELASDAAARGIRLCVEHVPGKGLPGAKEALAFVEQVGHANLFLLLDVGHTLISKEKPWEIVLSAEQKLGYVQLNDNDGKKDRHWPLLDGKLTLDDLTKTLESLHKIGYQSTLGLELVEQYHTALISSFSKNRNLVLRILQEIEKKAA